MAVAAEIGYGGGLTHWHGFQCTGKAEFDDPPRPPPQTPGQMTAQERQTAVTLAAARDLATEIEATRSRLRDESLNAAQRRELKVKIFDASERMCNLLALTIFQLASTLSRDFQARVNSGFAELRGRLLRMGTDLLVEKLERIRARAESVLAGEPYPLGLAQRLHVAFSEIAGADEIATGGRSKPPLQAD